MKRILPEFFRDDSACALLWAKSAPYKQLAAHMIDAGCCARAFLFAPSSESLLEFFLSQWHCSKEQAIAFVSYLTAVHDIGKAIPQFQIQNKDSWERLIRFAGEEYRAETSSEPMRHEHASARIMRRIWKRAMVPRNVRDSYACVLSLHHQKNNKSSGIRRAEPFPEKWQEMQDRLEQMTREVFGATDVPLVPKHLDAVCLLLNGIVILCDWVASSGPFDVESDASDDQYISFSLLTAEKTMERYGLVGNKEHADIHVFHDLWPQIKTPRDIQKQCEQLNMEAPITIIEAPMGEGKTEAALYVAEKMSGVWGKRGIYMALPTQATSNQMHGRILAMLEGIHGGSVRLMHGMAFLQNDVKCIQSEDEAAAERWLSTSRMGMLDENGVGTVDQAMAGVLFSRFSVLRLLGLANKVLVIDELHAYDAYMSEIIKILLQWCCVLHIPVVLLSATLQESQRRKYLSCFLKDSEKRISLSADYPLITQVTEDGILLQKKAQATMDTAYTFEAVPLGTDCKAIAEFANARTRKGGRYCVLVNTVKKAQDVYKALLEIKDDETETILFHARFPMGKRNDIEKECLHYFGKEEGSCRPGKAILVATQVVEQSLDIDFDGMLTDLAPIDLLLQRAGREHRHRNRKRPAGFEKTVIHVIVPGVNDDTNLEKRYADSGYVYAPFLLYNTEQLLSNELTVKVPHDLRQVISAVYEQVTEASWHVWQEQCFSQQLQQANAKGVAFPEPNLQYFFPAESHPEFSSLELDDGFETAMHASTRLGEPVMRVSFSTADMLEKARSGELTVEQQREIILCSVSLSMRHVTEKELISSELYRIEKTALKGCYISGRSDKVSIGRSRLVNDPVLGVLWEEQ